MGSQLKVLKWSNAGEQYVHVVVFFAVLFQVFCADEQFVLQDKTFQLGT
jgi:hypothetical protein